MDAAPFLDLFAPVGESASDISFRVAYEHKNMGKSAKETAIQGPNQRMVDVRHDVSAYAKGCRWLRPPRLFSEMGFLEYEVPSVWY